MNAFTSGEAYDYFIDTMEREMRAFLASIDRDAVERAADLIEAVRKEGGRVHVSGIGKPGHLAAYIASLLSSVGTPAYFLHATEAVHGSSGQLVPGDVVLLISNSGETAEMRPTVAALKANGCHLIGISGNEGSWLANESEIHLTAGVTEEGGPLNRAPRASFMAEAIVLQALSVVLQARQAITPEQYVSWHPGGALGQLREGEQ